jgi:uncharacterized linocin/CFP29 family protein
MSILRRSFAPLTADQWTAVDNEARGVLERTMVARRFVDVDGPHGWEHSAYNLGRLGDPQGKPPTLWRCRQVRTLVELRVPFALSTAELDDLARGAPEVDLDAVVHAARSVARFEEQAVYHGLSDAGIAGLFDASIHRSQNLPADPGAVLQVVAGGVTTLTDAGVEGPFLLVLGEAPFQLIAGSHDAYPVLRQLEELLGVRPALSTGLHGAALVSTRGGDFVLSLGVDASIGFERVDGDQVHLYLVQSFTFDVPGPEAVVTFGV